MINHQENSDRAERHLLGSVLRNPRCLDEVLPIVPRAEMFRIHAHGLIFQAVTDLHARGSVDVVTVADELTKRQQIKDSGDIVYLGELFATEPVGANAVYYANMVRDAWTLRAVGNIGRRLVQQSESPSGPVTEILATGERELFALAEEGVTGDVVLFRDVLDAVYDRFDARQNRGEATSGVPTGLSTLDDLTAGFQEGELTILAARPSVGKTALALWIIRQVAVLARMPVFFASLEQSRLELGDRMLCAHARVDSHRVRLGQCVQEDLDRLKAADAELRQAPLHIDDRPQQSVLRIASQARRLKRQHGLKLVVIDYLQLIEPESRREPRHEQVGQMSRRLKQLAREVGVPVICLAQLNREAEENEPRMRHLRESGDIEANADVILFLHPMANTNCGAMDVIVAKQRNGPTGRAAIIAEKSTFRFEVATNEPSFASDYAAKEPRESGRGGF